MLVGLHDDSAAQASLGLGEERVLHLRVVLRVLRVPP